MSGILCWRGCNQGCRNEILPDLAGRDGTVWSVRLFYTKRALDAFANRTAGGNRRACRRGDCLSVRSVDPDLQHLFCKRGAAAFLSYCVGCTDEAERASVVLEKRLRRAYTYLTENPETLCVLSGGQGSNEPVSEAQGMYEDLVKKGIDPKRLILEDQSTNTVENLRFSRKLIPQEVQKVGIVTSNFHVYRSLRLAKQQGFLDPVGISADSGVYFLPNNVLRECFGIVKDRLYGNLKFF